MGMLKDAYRSSLKQNVNGYLLERSRFIASDKFFNIFSDIKYVNEKVNKRCPK